MGTTMTLKWQEPSSGLPGFRLFEEIFDGPGVDGEPPVYLAIDGVDLEMVTRKEGGAAVTLTLPRSIARRLGVLPKGAEPTGD